MCNHHHDLSLEHFHHPQKNSISISSHSLFPHPPSSRQPLMYLLSLCLSILYISYKWNHSIWSFVTGFFHLEYLQGSSLNYHLDFYSLRNLWASGFQTRMNHRRSGMLLESGGGLKIQVTGLYLDLINQDLL